MIHAPQPERTQSTGHAANLPVATGTESLALPDGHHAQVRPITPASKPVLAAAMRRMSPESIRRRFFSPRRELTDLELQRLTEMDGWMICWNCWIAGIWK